MLWCSSWHGSIHDGWSTQYERFFIIIHVSIVIRQSITNDVLESFIHEILANRCFDHNTSTSTLIAFEA